ncbi:hypothetical protein TNCV_1103591 [Trichonephila clavipes]|nr:hypothetical protein TNCV_1103591 [Trichonephila clavipes]
MHSHGRWSRFPESRHILCYTSVMSLIRLPDVTDHEISRTDDPKPAPCWCSRTPRLSATFTEGSWETSGGTAPRSGRLPHRRPDRASRIQSELFPAALGKRKISVHFCSTPLFIGYLMHFDRDLFL